MSQMSQQLVELLKTEGQDFEFYPTTNEIIQALARDLRRGAYENFDGDDYHARQRYEERRTTVSFMDVGAGAGKVIEALRADSKIRFDEFYAIEKSLILIQRLDPSVYVVGTDFWQQSLLSKRVNVIFSNPPYKQFKEWTAKLIREASAKHIYLVIPERWKNMIEIADAIKYRDAKVDIIGNYDFENAEDRAARCHVQLVRLTLPDSNAFERFFTETFGELKSKFDVAGNEDDEAEKPAQKDSPTWQQAKALTTGEDYPAIMVGLYNQELAHILQNYEKISTLDAALLLELGVNLSSIMGSLKQRLDGLRFLYWKELFGRIKVLTDRLTNKKREQLLAQLNRHVDVDFTVDNISAVIIWVLKNANEHIDDQLVETYDVMRQKANVRNYKSNQRVFEADDWRYHQEKEKITHVYLDFRLVLAYLGGVKKTSYSFDKGLDKRGCEFLQDMLTVARNLGFNCVTNDARLDSAKDQWKPGQVEIFKFTGTDGKEQVLFEVRAFYNGSVHMRMNQKLALAMNVEYGRLKGWVSNGKEAAEELQDPKAAALFKSNFSLPMGTGMLALAAA